MSDSINRISPHGLAALASVLTAGIGDCEGGVVKAMILGDTNTLSTEANWNAVASLDQGGFILDEYEIGGVVRRETVTVSSISVVSGQLQITLDAPTWTSLASPDSTNEPSHILFYIELDGAVADATMVFDLRVPLAIVDAVFITDGTTFTPTMPSGGVLKINT